MKEKIKYQLDELKEENLLADTQVEIISRHLIGKRVVFCVGGGIAVVEAVKNIRELRRHGAEVKVYMSESASKFITPLSLEWASGQAVVTVASGAADHIFEGDGLVLAPATANTISKVVGGISDGLVTGLIASVLGLNMKRRKTKKSPLPIIFFPTMHESLYENPFFQKKLQELQDSENNTGVKVFTLTEQTKLEGKVKVPPKEVFTAEVIRAFKPSKKEKVLITGGMVPSYLDQIRFVANEASGQTAISLAKEIYLQGYSPTVLVHQSIYNLINFLKKDSGFGQISNITIIPFMGFVDYQEKVLSLIGKLEPSFAVFTAGVSDFKSPTTLEGKRPSTENWSLDLVPNEKVIAEVRKQYPQLRTVAFKLLSEASHTELYAAMNKLLENGHSLVVGNILEELKSNKDSNKSSNGSIPRYVVKNSSVEKSGKLGHDLAEFDSKVEKVNSQVALAEALVRMI